MKTIFLFLLLITGFESFATVYRIKVSNFQFSPKRVNAVVGDTILWVYKNGFHTTTSTTIPVGAAPWDSPMDVNTTKFSYVLTVPGVYNYFCLPHAGAMQGIIRVFPAAGVSVASFNIKPNKNGKPEIFWTFKAGKALAALSLLRSYDGETFEEIAKFSGKYIGITNYTDKQFDAGKIAHYSIKTTDASGIETETAIQSFSCTKPVKLITSLNPNPLTSQHLMMQFNADKESTMKVLLQDERGHVIKRESISAEPGLNNAHLHIEDGLLKPGTYYLVCILGNKKESHKIVKP